MRQPEAQAYETLTPAPDGARTSFLTTQRYKLASIAVWQNGERCVPSAYTATDALHVVFATAPRPGDTLEVQYNPA